ncbi:MAG: FAD-linked oxidase C-terminal domain-containing protein [Pseudomonadota bacterium]
MFGVVNAAAQGSMDACGASADWGAFCQWLAPCLGMPSLLATLESGEGFCAPPPEALLELTNALPDGAVSINRMTYLIDGGDYMSLCQTEASETSAAGFVLTAADTHKLQNIFAAAGRIGVSLHAGSTKAAPLQGKPQAGVAVNPTPSELFIDIDEDAQTARAPAAWATGALHGALAQTQWRLAVATEDEATDARSIAARIADGAAPKALVSALMESPEGRWRYTPGMSAAVLETAPAIAIEAVLQIRPAPQSVRRTRFDFPTYDMALEGARRIAQSGAAPHSLTLLEADDLVLGDALLKTGRKGVGALLGGPRRAAEEKPDACVIARFEGAPEITSAAMRLARRIARTAGASPMSRFKRAPSLLLDTVHRLALFHRGVGFYSMDLDAPWPRIGAMRQNLAAAAEASVKAFPAAPNAKALVVTRIVQADERGGRLSLHILFPRDLEKPVEQARAIEDALTEALKNSGDAPEDRLARRLYAAAGAAAARIADPEGVFDIGHGQTPPRENVPPNEQAPSPSGAAVRRFDA